MSQSLRAGSLFAGIGGFCLGLEQAGFQNMWAVEKDPAAATTYRENFPTTRLLDKDIKQVSVETDELEPVDVLTAGFPCQSFSKAGSRSGFQDERGKLVFEVIRLIKEFGAEKPSVILLENAPYFKIGEGGAWFLELQKEIKRAGYWFREANAKEVDSFSVTDLPQQRNRLFMVAFATKKFKNGKFSFPETVEGSEKNIQKYVDFGGTKKEEYYLPEDNKYYEMIAKYNKNDFRLYQLRKYEVRVKDPHVCPTLTANMGKGGHNVPFVWDSKGLRKLTERECAMLQGFPEWFSFPEEVTKAKRYTQIGNAVVVPVAKKLGQKISEKIALERVNE